MLSENKIEKNSKEKNLEAFTYLAVSHIEYMPKMELNRWTVNWNQSKAFI